jgi:hypothetical protein
MKELFISVFDAIGLAHWVEIVTDNPRCTYYFGPFLFKSDAEAEKMGYVEDLQGEGARIVSLSVKKCQPSNLTIFDEVEESRPLKPLVGLGSPVS